MMMTIIVLIMVTVLILMVATTVHAILDTLEMVSTAQVCVYTFMNAIIYILIFVVDINECLQSPSVCHSNATCNDNDGSYECMCKEGYTGDGKICIGMYVDPL